MLAHTSGTRTEKHSLCLAPYFSQKVFSIKLLIKSTKLFFSKGVLFLVQHNELTLKFNLHLKPINRFVLLYSCPTFLFSQNAGHNQEQNTSFIKLSMSYPLVTHTENMRVIRSQPFITTNVSNFML